MGKNQERTDKDIEQLKREIDQLFEIWDYIIEKVRERAPATAKKEVKLVAFGRRRKGDEKEWCRGVLTEVKILLDEGRIEEAKNTIKKALEKLE